MNRATSVFSTAAMLLAGCDRAAPPDDPAARSASASARQTVAASGAPAATAPTDAAPSVPAPLGSTPSVATPSTSPCLTQDGKPLAVAPLRAVGTEPFWGANIEGRCVTYSHPDDQQGTRVWTRYTAGPGGGGTWAGNLGGKPFVLTARPQAGCSDGMSDRRYPFAVALTVGGEQRTGCAEPR